jgi:UDP-N-acetylglucosamine--N-acetylmuramyl-(pentapeptide) pyrophosphoryl-undecaprenol N-acetylglucosamine transferase
VLVPYPAAADDHQLFNARVFEQAGASQILVESKTTPEMLYETVTGILAKSELRNRMATAARKLAGEDAAKRVAEEIEASCNRN